MDNAIQVYCNDSFTVRTTREADGTVWFVGKDVLNALEYSETSTPAQIFQSVPDFWKGIKRIDTVERGLQDMLCLTEQGLYFFLGRSDKPKALPYQIWVAGDVVPSIQRTGSYSARKEQPVMSAGIMEGAKVILEAAKIEGNQLTIALDNLYRSYTGHSVLKEGGIELIAPTKNQLLTPTDIGKEFGLSAQRVNQILAGAGWQHKIANKWEPLELGELYAVMQDTGIRHSETGTPVRQLKWDSSILERFGELIEEAG